MTPAELLPYLTTIIGALIVIVLNGIKSEIREVKTTLTSVEKDLREGINSLDHRVAVIETRCEVVHKK